MKKKLILIGYNMDNEIKELSKEHPAEEPTPEEVEKAQLAAAMQRDIKLEENVDKFNDFLTRTRLEFDKYFSHLGYACFVFSKTNQANEAALISNVEVDDAIRRTLPYGAKLKRLKLKESRKFRRMK